MLYKDIVDEKGKRIEQAIDVLLQEAIKNQSHPGDLLLLLTNGYHDAEITTPGYSPYVIGSGFEGLSEHTHYNFINSYRYNYLHEMAYEDYIKLFEWSQERDSEIKKLQFKEDLSVHLEMLIYLKIWEADLFIKRFYQLTKIAHGEAYDWHFRIAHSNRDNDATGTRQDIIRNQIRDKIRPLSEDFYKILKETYVTQLRNAIAHSNFSFMGRHIQLYNYVASDPTSQLKALKLDIWIDIFHNTIMLYNSYIGLINKLSDHYTNVASKNDNKIEVRVTKDDGTIELRNVLPRGVKDSIDWIWETQAR